MDGTSSARADEEILADLCVIGAGPAGITLAHELDRLGISVCLLEAGGLEVERPVQAQSRGESDGYPLHPLDRSRVRAFGGTLRHHRIWDEGWAARPLDAIDFEPRAGRSDLAWPFRLADLDGYYARAEKVCGIIPFADAAALWYQDLSPAAQTLVGPRLGEVEGAVFQYPTTAFHDSWAELSSSPDVQIHLHTRVLAIEVDSSRRRVGRVVAVKPDGSRLVVRPRFVVLATGGIENARLLLAANDGKGLGNEHDLVGRHFAERLSFYAGHMELSGSATPEALDVFHQAGRGPIGGALRVCDEEQRERGLLNCAFFLVPRPVAITTPAARSLTTLRKAIQRRPRPDAWGRHLRNLATGVPDLANVVAGRFVDRPQALTVRVLGEPSPNPSSRVTLGHRRDDLGTPVPRVTWAVTQPDLDSIREAAGVLDGALRESGLGSLTWTARLDSTTLIEGNHHHLGTTRMHQDPDHGVVDPDSKVHSMDNLYLAGSSVFPSHGASNPTLTIVALALRLADHLRARLEH